MEIPESTPTVDVPEPMTEEGSITLINYEIYQEENLRPLWSGGQFEPIGYGKGRREMRGMIDVYASGKCLDRLYSMMMDSSNKVPLYFVMPGSDTVCTGTAIFSQMNMMGGVEQPDDVRITLDFYALDLVMRQRKPFESKQHKLGDMKL
jgi:hypothetical protein